MTLRTTVNAGTRSLGHHIRSSPLIACDDILITGLKGVGCMWLVFFILILLVIFVVGFIIRFIVKLVLPVIVEYSRSPSFPA